ncbi:unnamed protein product [Caenorhabditis brenneri]
MTEAEASAFVLKTMGPILIFKKIIGQGGFGVIHQGYINVNNAAKEVAVKFFKEKKHEDAFKNELEFYKEAKRWHDMHVPQLYYHAENKEERVLAIDLLGPSLDSLHLQCHRKFTLKTALLIADQFIPLLEDLHAKGYIHRDLKPDNFVIGKGPDRADKIYLIDFGHVEKFMNKYGKHNKKVYSKHVAGTVKFMSPNGHIGKSQSRRDDLIAVIYILIFFQHGSLPWQFDEFSSMDDRLLTVYHHKQDYIKETLKLCAPEFGLLYDSLTSLKYAETPNYGWYKEVLRGLAERSGIKYDFKFDWKELGFVFLFISVYPNVFYLTFRTQ